MYQFLPQGHPLAQAIDVSVERQIYDEERARLAGLNTQDFLRELVEAIGYGYFGYDPYYASVNRAFMDRAKELLNEQGPARST